MFQPISRGSRLGLAPLLFVATTAFAPSVMAQGLYFHGFVAPTNTSCPTTPPAGKGPMELIMGAGIGLGFESLLSLEGGALSSRCENQKALWSGGALIFPFRTERMRIGIGVHYDAGPWIDPTTLASRDSSWIRPEAVLTFVLRSTVGQKRDKSTVEDALLLDLRAGRFQGRSNYLAVGLKWGVNFFPAPQ